MRGIWKPVNKSRLIESLLLRIPIPVCYVAADVDDNWEVVDGVQRISTLYDYVTDQFMKLSEKSPLLSGLASEITDRFRMCEARTLPPDDGAPLVLCAVTDAICVGMPSEPVWDRDRLPVDFEELLPDGRFADAREEIDNLTRSVHAGPIVDRHRTRLRHQCSNVCF